MARGPFGRLVEGLLSIGFILSVLVWFFFLATLTIDEFSRLNSEGSYGWLFLLVVGGALILTYGGKWYEQKQKAEKQRIWDESESHRDAQLWRDHQRKKRGEEILALAEIARQRGDTCEAQELHLQAMWVISGPPDESEVPIAADIDPANDRHLRFMDNVRGRYARVLENPGDFAGCMFRPEDQLPVPREYLYRTLHLMLAIAEERVVPEWWLRAREIGMEAAPSQWIGEEAAETIRTCAFLLDDFLPVPADRLPRDPAENARFGMDWKEKTKGTLPPIISGPR
jgi:hypothetical protein